MSATLVANGGYVVGQPYTISINGATPNSQVYVFKSNTPGYSNAALTDSPGSTDGNGNFTVTYAFQPSDAGLFWTQVDTGGYGNGGGGTFVNSWQFNVSAQAVSVSSSVATGQLEQMPTVVMAPTANTTNTSVAATNTNTTNANNAGLVPTSSGCFNPLNSFLSDPCNVAGISLPIGILEISVLLISGWMLLGGKK